MYRKANFIIAGLLVAALAGGLMIANAAYGQQFKLGPAVAEEQPTRPVLNPDDSFSHNECNPTRHRKCTPYATEKYRRECNPDYRRTRRSEVSGDYILVASYINENTSLITAIDTRLTTTPPPTAEERTELESRKNYLESQKTLAEAERDAETASIAVLVARHGACSDADPVFHTAPNFCPKQLPDGRVRYSGANCRR